MKKNLAQVSVEYLLIVGFITVVTVPLIIIYYDYTSSSTDEIVGSQLNQIATKIADAAESVYFLGAPSQTTLRVYFPDRISKVNLSNREIYFKVKTKNGYYDVVQISSVNLTGSLPTKQGLYNIVIKSRENYVEISYS